jgi:O-antigen/teichoic acid export membrane protein
VVLGDRWSQAAPVLQVLSWVGLLQSLQTMNGDILQALDRTGALLRYTAIFFVAHLAAFAVGLRWGIVGVACGYAVSSTVVEPMFTWVTARALGVSPWAFPRALRGVAGAGAAMLAMLLLFRFELLPENMPALARLAVLTIVGAATYIPLCLRWAPELRSEATSLRRKRRGHREVPTVAVDPAA